MSNLQSVTFSGEMLARGFWLYVWVVTADDDSEYLYVGRTGDNSSPFAQSPYRRMGQHLGVGDKNTTNMLRRNLANVNVDASRCKSFEMVAYGPILPEASNMEEHIPRRNVIAAMEKELRDVLHSAGYTVLNRVSCKHPLDRTHWNKVLEVFSEKFPKLKQNLD